MLSFTATIYKIGINPYVLLPTALLKEICRQAAKDKGPIPVKGTINKHVFTQTLVKYSGKWRLYINGPMLAGSGSKLGDRVDITIVFDAAERITTMHPKLRLALKKNKAANTVFKTLPPSRQKEIMRYINNLKSETAIDNNIKKAISFLTGGERFIGRDKP